MSKRERTPALVVEQIAYHRNGMCGAPFHAVTFTHRVPGEAEDRPMIAVVFQAPGHVAVFDRARLGLGFVEFGGIDDDRNSWRGDRFETDLRRAIAAHEAREQAEADLAELHRRALADEPCPADACEASPAPARAATLDGLAYAERTAADWAKLPIVACACGQKFYQERADQTDCRDCESTADENARLERRELEIVKNVRTGEREDRHGRVRTVTITTWDIVHADACRLVSEHDTKGEAVAALAKLQGGAQ
jgi:hypothetical protein